MASALDVNADELERAALFRSSLRRFLARTEEVAGVAGLTSQRYDLLLAIKTAPGGTSTVSELSKRLSLRQTAATELVKRAEEAGLIERSASTVDRRIWVLALSAEGERRLLEAFVSLRDDRRRLAEAMGAVSKTFRAFVRSQGERDAR